MSVLFLPSILLSSKSKINQTKFQNQKKKQNFIIKNKTDEPSSLFLPPSSHIRLLLAGFTSTVNTNTYYTLNMETPKPKYPPTITTLPFVMKRECTSDGRLILTMEKPHEDDDEDMKANRSNDDDDVNVSESGCNNSLVENYY
ncbi:hypothetical protein Q3G72_011302 [Acer saccharum]|nr:hypothetical protein Q3G72_011302 [Acer saccharum]